jgi:hypothetical protein
MKTAATIEQLAHAAYNARSQKMKHQRIIVALLIGSGILAAAAITSCAAFVSPAHAGSPGFDYQPTGAGNAFKFRLEPTGPSFNCNYAKTPDEVLICQNPKLSSLDETLADLFFLLRNEAYAWRQTKMTSEQANWLRWRMHCGRDFDCIRQAYVGRIIELQNQQAAVCGITGPKLASDAFCAIFFDLHDTLN